MARKKTPHLTDAEVRLMEVLWEDGPLTVSGVVDQLSSDPPLAYSTVLTTLRILETKGYVKHTMDGRAFVYRAVVAREKARSKAITHVLHRFFEDSPELLVLNLVNTRKMTQQDLKRLWKRLEEKGE